MCVGGFILLSLIYRPEFLCKDFGLDKTCLNGWDGRDGVCVSVSVTCSVNENV